MPTTGSPDCQHLLQRKPDLLDEHRLQLGDRRGERRLIGQQLPAHARPTANPDPNTRTPCPIRAWLLMGVHHPHRRVTGRQCLQPGHRLGAITRTHRGDGLMPGAVMIDGVGHIGQRHTGALTGHPLGQHRPPSTPPAPGVLPDTTNVLTTGSGCPTTGSDSRSLLNHHMRIGATDPERGHPRPPRPPHRRPLHGLRGDDEPRRTHTGMRRQRVEIQMSQEYAHDAH